MSATSYIRLNNKFVYRKGKRYFVTNITKRGEWSEMTTKQKERCKGKDVTQTIKQLIKEYGSKSNMNFKTGKTVRKIRDKRLTKKRKKTKGGARGKFHNTDVQVGGG